MTDKNDKNKEDLFNKESLCGGDRWFPPQRLFVYFSRPFRSGKEMESQNNHAQNHQHNARRAVKRFRRRFIRDDRGNSCPDH